MTIQAARIRVLNDQPPRPAGRYVLYLMQQSQRAGFNPALELAVEEANRLGCPVVVGFGLLDGASGFPEANARHYAFMLQGLADAKAELDARGIAFVVRKASPAALARELAGEAALLILDRGYLSIQKHWYAEIGEAGGTRVIQVEGDVVVPVETASPKHEFAARTLRPKLQRLMDDFIAPLAPREVTHRADDLGMASEVEIGDPAAVLAGLTLDRSVAPVRRFTGGRIEALRRLRVYLAGPFARYGTERGRPRRVRPRI